MTNKDFLMRIVESLFFIKVMILVHTLQGM